MNLYEVYEEIIRQCILPEDKLKSLIELFLESIKLEEVKGSK